MGVNWVYSLCMQRHYVVNQHVPTACMVTYNHDRGM